MARVMATHRFDATIVFMAVAGEEQGLFGSEHFAEQARKHHLDVAGMLDNDIIGDAERRPTRTRSGSSPRAFHPT